MNYPEKELHYIASHINAMLNQCVFLYADEQTRPYASSLHQIATGWAQDVLTRFHAISRPHTANKLSGEEKLHLHRILIHPLHQIIETLKAIPGVSTHATLPVIIDKLGSAHEGMLYYLNQNQTILNECHLNPDRDIACIASFLDALEHEEAE